MREQNDKNRRWEKEQMTVNGPKPIAPQETKPCPSQSASWTAYSKTSIDRTANNAIQDQKRKNQKMYIEPSEQSLPDIFIYGDSSLASTILQYHSIFY